MKRRILALALAMTMVAGTGMTVLAAEHDGTDSTTDGTADAAAVGEDKVMTDGKGQTDFYLVVDKDATSPDGPVIGGEDLVGDGDVIYKIAYTKSTTSNLSVTVPLYVCMYAYGGDGKVVVPTADAYQMKNSSTQAVNSNITAIYPCYKVAVIDDNTNEDILTALDGEVFNQTGAYGYYNDGTDDAPAYHAVALADCFKKAADAEDTYYMPGTELVEKTVEVDGKTYTVGQAHPDIQAETTGQAVRVASIQATPMSSAWDLKAVGSSLLAHEFTMTIKNQDLSEVTELTDITSLAWNMTAPTVTNGAVDEATTLSLPITAAIAGNSVNEDAHVGVVSVEYTVAPVNE